jgi:hypothetical protein
VDNITRRETKRPSARPRDKAYQRRFSSGTPPALDGFSTSPGIVGGEAWPRDEPSNRLGGVVTVGFNASRNDARCTPSPYAPSPKFGGRQGDDPSFQISLTYEGQSVLHQVWGTMPILQLIDEVEAIFGSDTVSILLVLVSLNAATLYRDSTINGPPAVRAGANVMVLRIVPSVGDPRRVRNDSTFRIPIPPVSSSLAPVLSSKVLNNFKLPKLDGVSKNWKAWDKAFQRFLGLHQLDHVLDDDFLSTLWTVPGAKESNKIVFCLLEDAVAAGSLGARFIRQTTKWNEHEAYVLLYNGYVFSGPQTATILLAELSQLRLKRDENASTFCLRLVELIGFRDDPRKFRCFSYRTTKTRVFVVSDSP